MWQVEGVDHMASTSILHEARVARERAAIGRIDYQRALKRLRLSEMTQTEVARELRISQPAVSQLYRTAAEVELPRPGFSAATILELCQRYAAGFIDRAQLLDELARWDYSKPTERTDYFDADLSDEDPNSPRMVAEAVDRGLIDESVYEDWFTRRRDRL